MEFVWSRNVDKILQRGIFLRDLGIKNWALSKDDALKALSELMIAKIPVIGCDVCEFENGIIQLNYDNWYCEPKKDELKSDFASRTIEMASSYIENYKSNTPKSIFFILVPEV
jgi:hypothetical protein